MRNLNAESEKTINNYKLALNLEMYKNKPDIYVYIAKCYYNLEDFKNAQEFVSRGLKLKSDYRDLMIEQLQI